MLLGAAPAIVALSLLSTPSRAEDMGLNDSDELCLDFFEAETIRALRAEVDKTLASANAGRNVRLQEYQVIRQKTDPPRFYPLVGAARMVRSQVRCTLDTPSGREVVYIDIAQLRAGTK